ncbi:hypothetical protein E0Z06_13240 [Rheinheimera sp. D18]|uniref:hypothetical protein n=1 Tax=Rheinheimera sp. D18 TaxID=2545632 RepID=UPI00104ED4C8|nr:hypothetical protein [Rheinheimera sp. D18]QBL10424.1 hypothetical protein E0Z06_13240 [Rheinheimera sp. D18]
MSDTIERIMVTFFDVIYSANKEWTETEIRQQLIGKGYSISQSQLNRDLNRYHHHFGVERLDQDNSYYTKPVYRRKQNRISEARMSEGEVQFLTALLTIREHVGQHLPPEAEHYLDNRIQALSSQRSILQRNVPHHPMFALEQNLQLLTKHTADGSIDEAIATALRIALTKQQDVSLQSSEYGVNQHDTFSPIKLYEHRGDLYVSGMSALEGGTNRDYCISKLLSVQNVTIKPAQPTPQLGGLRR